MNEAVEAQNWFRNPFSSKHRKFEGVVNNDGFKIVRLIHFGNPWRAVRRFHADLEALGLRKRRQHDCRRTFTSLARGDGAPGELVDWITHGPSGSIVDVYTTMPWPTLCGAVSKLKIEVRKKGKLLELRRVVAGAPCDNPCDSESPGMKKPPRLVDLGAKFTEREKGFELPRRHLANSVMALAFLPTSQVLRGSSVP